MQRLAPLLIGVSLVALACTKPAEPLPSGAAPAAEADAPKAEAKADAPKAEPAHDDHHNHEVAASTQPGKPLGKGESPTDRDQKDDDGVVRRGDAFTAAAALSVEDCIGKSKELNGKTVKIEGTVNQVCAKKGCWFALAPDVKAGPEKTIRITSKGYRFFVPKDAVGQQATIEGELEVKTMSVEEAQHMAEDAAKAKGEAVPKVTEPQVEVRIAAVAVEMKKSDS
jgi:hypothetical protein